MNPINESGKVRVIPLPKDEEQTPKAKKPKKKSANAAVDTQVATAALAKTFAALNKEDYQLLASSPRRRAREASLMLFYQIDSGNEDLALADTFLTDIKLKDDGQQFARDLVAAATADIQKSDQLINVYAKEWSVDRLAIIDRSILRLAISEMRRDKESNANIIINEAIELAKKFGDESSPAFINGILDAIHINELPGISLKES